MLKFKKNPSPAQNLNFGSRGKISYNTTKQFKGYRVIDNIELI